MKPSTTRAAVLLNAREARLLRSKPKTKARSVAREKLLEKASVTANKLARKIKRPVGVLGGRSDVFYTSSATRRKNPDDPVAVVAVAVPAKSRNPDEVPNLDAMDPAELDAFAKSYDGPCRPALRRYASLKATAMRLRSSGNIQRAVDLEARLDERYDELPEACRW